MFENILTRTSVNGKEEKNKEKIYLKDMKRAQQKTLFFKLWMFF